MTISSSVGPISGIDYGKLITGLIGLQQRPIDQITKRLEKLDDQNNAFTEVTALLTGLRITANNFASAAIFRSTTATPANPSIMTASGGIGAPIGNYTFNVQRLASASQQVTQGFAASTTPLGLAGSIKLQLGGGRLDDIAKLTSLNGGSGVARGSIRLTDASGATSLIDLSRAVDARDVVNTLNSATGVSVVAKLDGDRLVVTDNSGGAGTLSIANTGGTTTGSDLGLTTAAVSGVITGAALTNLRAGTSLDTLNDGLGVRTTGVNDFSITGSTAVAVNVSLAGAKTLNEAIGKINTAGQAQGLSAALSADGKGITLTDSGGGPITVAALAGSLAAHDLGIEGAGAGGTLVGSRIASSLQGPLLKNLNGGWQGQAGETSPTFGTITINAETIDLSTARTLDDALKLINANSQGVTAAINNAGTGVTLSSASPSFTIADGTGNLASFLNIDGTSTATTSGSQITSGDLRSRYISDNTRLSSLNGGLGIKMGSIRVSGSKVNPSAPPPIIEETLVFDLSKETTIGGVVSRLNATGLGITARINDTGDGILLTQTIGTEPAKIEDANGGNGAKLLGIAGTFADNKLDGSLQKTLTIVATDTLADISKKINDANSNISAAIVNDGSGANPFRLSLISRNTGVSGRIVFDGSGIGLDMTQLVEGQDASLVFGGNANGTGGLLFSNASNTIAGVVPGLTVTANGIGNTTVSVNRNDEKIKESLGTFVESYNKIVEKLAEATKFDTDPTKRGILFGNSAAQQVQSALGQFLGRSYGNVGKFTTLASVGLTIGQDGKISLNEQRFSDALAASPDDVRTFFTTNIKAIAGGPKSIKDETKLSDLAATTFPSGHISITDGFGAAHDIDLSSVTTIGQVKAFINSGTAGKITASINPTGDGILLTQVGGTGTAFVSEVNGGATATALRLNGTFVNGQLNGAFPVVQTQAAVKGVGVQLSELIDRYTNAQIGLLFRTTDSILAQTRQLKNRQTELNTLLNTKKERLIREFAMLEVNLSQLQQQGTALGSYTASQANK